MTIHEIRQKYLEYFKSKDHAILPSSSLLPENDPTTLFTGSGMQPLVPYLLGEKHPQGTRLADSQKCFRTQDIDEIGDNRHTTFFEMLGNWSLGDYFKQEQLTWMFEFLTQKLNLDPNRLYVTVFKGNDKIGIERDKETADLWKQLFAQHGIDAQDIDNSENKGMRQGRIFYYKETKNWWSRVGEPDKMPVGEPGGPDSEIFWDFGAELKLHENSPFKDSPCHVNCECGRFLEIGNNVFMQYIKTEKGFDPLPKKNVDFGGGLERITQAVNNDPDIYNLEVFKPAKNILEKLSSKSYDQDSVSKTVFRVIMDHLRAAMFLINDGAPPSNKDQGYFTRRLIRRSIRFANRLDIKQRFCEYFVKTFIEQYKDAYPLLLKNQDHIIREINTEEKKFAKTLEKGLREFNKIISQYKEQESKTHKQIKELESEQAFKLYDTYGFPFELTQELAKEQGLGINKQEFEKLLKKHQELSRAQAEKKFKGGLADQSEQTKKLHTATHLLHQALREVLGDHVQQKGSNITADRLRFDFSHPEKMTPEQIQKVEDLVNKRIKSNLPINVREMSLDEAEKSGALGFFKERYGDKVKVYEIGDYSAEICGGPHVAHTGELGKFHIKKEEASSSGVRRIKAVLE